MASDNAPVTSPSARRLRAFFVLVLLLVALIAGVGGWFLKTERGARTAFSLLPANIKADGVHGRLAGPLHIDRLTVQLESQTLALRNIQLDWQPAALLNGLLHVQSLQIGDLAVSSKSPAKKEPLHLPDSIALPFAVRLDKVILDGGQITDAMLNPVKLSKLVLDLNYNHQRYLLRISQLAAQLQSPQGDVSGNFNGQMTLGTRKPYALQAALSSGAEALLGQQTFGMTGHLQANGSLEEIIATTDLVMNQTRVKGKANLQPFSAQPLGDAEVTAQAVDLSLFKEGLPKTHINLTLSSKKSGDGALTLINEAAGFYNEKLLPLSNLSLSFQQHNGQIMLQRMLARLGTAKLSAGEVEGSGKLADGTLTLDFLTRSLNLQRIDQRIRPTQLAGQVHIAHKDDRQEVTLDLSEPLKKQKMTLNAHALMTAQHILLDRALLQIGSGRAEITAQIALAGQRQFKAEGKVAQFRLKELGSFDQLSDLILNGQFTLSGAREPKLVADLAFNINNSSIAGQVLKGEGKAQLRADRIEVSNLSLDAGDNHLAMRGKLSEGDGALNFSLSAPKLEQLGPQFSGALDANGTAHGSFLQPQLSLNWNGSKVRLLDKLQFDNAQGKADIRLDRKNPLLIDTATAELVAKGIGSGAQKLDALSAQLQFSPKPNAALQISIRAKGLASGKMRADSVTADVRGTTAQHTLEAILNAPGQDWTVKASGGVGGLPKTPHWQGEIQALDAKGKFSGHLATAAPLLVSAQKTQLQQFRFEGPVALVNIENFLRDQHGIVSRGKVERVEVSQLLAFSDPQPLFTTDLQLSGEWDISLLDTLAGNVHIRRDRGDIVIRGNSAVALGLRELDARATATSGQITMQLRVDGQRAGHIEVDGKASATIRPGQLALVSDAPVAATIKVDIPSLGWVGTLASPNIVAEGRLQSTMSMVGTLAQPTLAGQIKGDGLRVLFADTGVDLRHGTLESEFKDTQLIIKNASFGAPSEQLDISGKIDFSGGKPAAQIEVKADHFPIVDRSDRRIRVSGKSQVNMGNGQMKVAGNFIVNSGLIDISSTNMPKLSDDVVIVGSQKKKVSERGLPAALDIGIGLGDGITLKGRGLNATLVGDIRLLNEAGTPLHANGTLKISEGTFAAYGRELAIEQGLVRFNGQIDNPQLDILAMRRGQEVEAGVSVRGTVLSPRIALVSEPTVPDAEKLSWLVLGRGLGTAGEGDISALQGAASSLLSKGAAAGVQSQIARTFGLDDFSVGSSNDTLQERIVTLGKKISSKLYVGFEQGIETASSVLRLRYTLSKKLTLEAEAGTRSALSLFYNLGFD